MLAKREAKDEEKGRRRMSKWRRRERGRIKDKEEAAEKTAKSRRRRRRKMGRRIRINKKRIYLQCCVFVRSCLTNIWLREKILWNVSADVPLLD